MNAESTHSSQLHAMLDGTLDAAGEQAVLDLLARDPSARQEFARLAQLHAWLAADDHTRKVLAAPAPGRRRIIVHPAWWLAAAIAAAVIIITASRLWPAPGIMNALASRDRIYPVLAAACFRCHENLDALLAGNSRAGFAMITPGHPEQSALWLRVQGDNPCSRSLDAAGRSLLMEWISGSSHGSAAS